MSFRLRDRAVLVTLVIASMLSPGRLALAAGKEPQASSESAAMHFRHGVALYKDADYEGALAEFHRAQELSPNYRLLYNIGQALYSLQRYAEAIKAFEDYLAQGGAQLAPARRAAVEGDLRALRERVGHIDILVNVDGAEIRVDDQAVGTSPLPAPVLVSVGHRKVTVSKADRAAVEKFVDIASGDHAKLTFELVSPAATVAAAPPPHEVTPPPAPIGEAHANPPAPPPAEPARSASLVWLPWALTGAFGVGTAVTGGLTLSAKSSLSKDLSTFPGDPHAIDSDRSRAKTLSVASDVLLAATAVSFGVAMYVTLRHHPDRVGASDGLKLGLGLGGVRLAGDF